MGKPLVLACCVALLLAAANPARAEAIVLRPDRVFTAEDRQAHSGWVVVVEGKRILQAGPSAAVSVPPQARVIELHGATLLPGLIDAHSHVFLHPYNEALWNDQVLKESTAYRSCAPPVTRATRCWRASRRCATSARRVRVPPTWR